MKTRVVRRGASAEAPRATPTQGAVQMYNEAKAALGALATLTRQKLPDGVQLPMYGSDDLTLRLYARLQGAPQASKYTRRALAEITEEIAAHVIKRARELAEEDHKRALAELRGTQAFGE